MLKGVALKIASTLAFSFMMAIMKAHTNYPVGELVMFRSAPALLVLFFWLAQRREFPAALRTKWLSGHLVRSIAGSCSMFMMFATYNFLPLADSTAVLYSGPLMIVVLSGLMLGEPIGALRIGVVAMGFLGVVIMLFEHLGGADPTSARGVWGVLTGLSGALFSSVAMIQTRRLAQTEHTGAIVFYFQTVATCVGAAVTATGLLYPSFLPLAGFVRAQGWVTPTLWDFAIMFAAGLFGGLGQLLMTKAYVYADASIIASFEYVSMIWVVALGILFLGEVPSLYVFAGGAVVAAAGLLLIIGEKRRKIV
jgi:drug/metabolite transporter (DMT)-like permease